MLETIAANKDVAAVAISALALMVSLFTFYRSWRKDRGEALKALEARKPLIAVTVDRADRKPLTIFKGTSVSGRAETGWAYHLALEVQNRFECAATLVRVTAAEAGGAPARLYAGIGAQRSHFGALLFDRPTDRIRPIKPGDRMLFHCDLHLERDFPVEAVRSGIAVEFGFEFELQAQSANRERTVCTVKLLPQYVSAR